MYKYQQTEKLTAGSEVTDSLVPFLSVFFAKDFTDSGIATRNIKQILRSKDSLVS